MVECRHVKMHKQVQLRTCDLNNLVSRFSNIKLKPKMDDTLSLCSYATFKPLNNSTSDGSYRNGAAISTCEPDSIKEQTLTRTASEKISKKPLTKNQSRTSLEVQTNTSSSDISVVRCPARNRHSQQTAVCGISPDNRECPRQSLLDRNQRPNKEPSRTENCPTEMIPNRPRYMRSISDVLTESEIQHRVEQYARNIEIENLFDPYKVFRPRPLELYRRRYDRRLRKVNQWLVIKKRIQKSKLRQRQNSSSQSQGSSSTFNTNTHTGQPPHSVWISLDSENDTSSSNTGRISNTQECLVNNKPTAIHINSVVETNVNVNQKSKGGPDRFKVSRDRSLIIVDSDEELSTNDIQIPSNSKNKQATSKDFHFKTKRKHRKHSIVGKTRKELIIYVDSDDNISTGKTRRSTPGSDSDVIEVNYISDSEDEPRRIQEKGKQLVSNNYNSVQINNSKGTGITQRSSNQKVNKLHENTATGSTGHKDQTQTVQKIAAKPKKQKKRKCRTLKKCAKASSSGLLKNLKD